MIELARRRMTMRAKPYDAEVEWLGSTGTQYIDTLYYPNINTEIRLTFVPFTPKSHSYLCGCCSVNYKTQVLSMLKTKDENNLRLFFGGNVSSGMGNYYGDYQYVGDIYMNKFYVSLDGVRYYYTEIPSTTSISHTLYVYARNNIGVADFFTEFKLKSLYISENAQLVRSFIPVRKNGVGYLYDKVSGQLFGNQGTGQFIIGPDK